MNAQREPFAAVDAKLDHYVDTRRLAGYSVYVEQAGALAHEHHYGVRDLESGVAWDADTLVRIFSMTKPLTSVAALQLVERGALSLDDPVERFIAAFGSLTVHSPDGAVPATTPMLVSHLLSHTSGLTYELYDPVGDDLAAVCDEWAAAPLRFEPGQAWWYGVSTDVLGRVIEVASGQPLDHYFDEHILGPLGMTDTSFTVPPDHRDRVATLYTADRASQTAVRMRTDRNPPGGRGYLSGGGGLWGTARDYLRFCRMMLDGGVFDGVRLVSADNIALMTSNLLPGGADLHTFGRDPSLGDDVQGVGFGYGFAVELGEQTDNSAPRVSPGSYWWGGAASTGFWCDPLRDEAVVFATQLMPDTVPIRDDLVALLAARPIAQ